LLSDKGQTATEWPDLAQRSIEVIPALGEDAQPIATCEDAQRRIQHFPIQCARRRDRLEAAGEAHQEPLPPAVGDIFGGKEDDPGLRRQRHQEEKSIDPVAVRPPRHDQGLTRGHVLPPADLDAEAEQARPNEPHPTGRETGLERLDRP